MNNQSYLGKILSFNFLILCFRWYLAFYMFDYGWSKIVGNQFGVFNEDILNKPLKDIDKFYVAWHLFSLDKTFNLIIGFFQIIGAVLIIFNKTKLIGALFLLPIIVQILLIDIAFTTNMFGLALPIRLLGMLIADLSIIYFYKAQFKLAWLNLTQQNHLKIKYEWWILIFMPVIGFAMDFIIGVIMYPLQLLLQYIIQ